MNNNKKQIICRKTIYCEYCCANKDIFQIMACEYERGNRGKIKSYVGSVCLNSNFSSFLATLNEEKSS